MTVRVESCWNGHDTYWRLTLPDGRGEFIGKGRSWDRKLAGEAKSLFENVYHIPRRNIRFRRI